MPLRDWSQVELGEEPWVEGVRRGCVSGKEGGREDTIEEMKDRNGNCVGGQKMEVGVGVNVEGRDASGTEKGKEREKENEGRVME